MGSSVEVDELSWRCRKRSPFHKTSAWFFCAGSNRQVAHPSHLMGSQLGFFVPGEPRTGDTRRVLESAIPQLSHRALSAICGGQHQVEPDPIVHNPPSRRLNNRRHHQWKFMITHFQIHNDRSSSCVTNKHTKQLGWLAWNHTNAVPVEEVFAVPERDTVSQVITASEKNWM